MTEIFISSPFPSPLGGEGKGEGRFGYWLLFGACLPAVGREFGY